MSSNRYLLDTNILVFFIGDKSRLSKKIISILSDSANLLYTSSL